jgi:hypothetical protein
MPLQLVYKVCTVPRASTQLLGDLLLNIIDLLAQVTKAAGRQLELMPQTGSGLGVLVDQFLHLVGELPGLLHLRTTRDALRPHIVQFGPGLLRLAEQ